MKKGNRPGFIVLVYGSLCALAMTHPPHVPGRGGVIRVSSVLPVSKPASLERKLVKGKARFDKPAEAQEYYRAKRAPVGETAVPVERYLGAQRQMRNMSVYSTASDLMAPIGMTASAMQALSTLGGARSRKRRRAHSRPGHRPRKCRRDVCRRRGRGSVEDDQRRLILVGSR